MKGTKHSRDCRSGNQTHQNTIQQTTIQRDPTIFLGCVGVCLLVPPQVFTKKSKPDHAARPLRPGGRLVVVDFEATENAPVFHRFQDRSASNACRTRAARSVVWRVLGNMMRRDNETKVVNVFI